MAIDGVNTTNYTSASRSSSSSTKRSDSTKFSLDNYLQLLAAQLRNQDMMNPMSDSEFMSQMAQYSTLEAIQDMQNLSYTTYAVGMVGKEVTVARITDTGQLETKSGIVTGVGLFEGSPVIYLEDEQYYMEEIMVVGKSPSKEEENNTNNNGE